MNDGFKLPIWAARCCGNQKNCVYPDAWTATNIEEFKDAVKNDHTFICFKNNYRSEENYKYALALTEDIDNTHSEDPGEWLSKEDIMAAFPDVQMLIYTSRNHMKVKEGKAARPRYHIVFFVDRIDSPADYKLLLQMMKAHFPYFDAKAQDAARFFYGNPDTEVYVQPGLINLSAFFDMDEFARMEKEIREGSRNDTLFRWAVSSMKRYGDTEETIKRFYMMAERCNPPLPDEELQSILKSASKYYAKIKKDPEYISPEVYNATGPVRWEEPLPFGKHTIEQFPVDALPKDIADYVTAVAKSTQTPVDMAGTVALSIMSMCQQSKFCIQGKPDWIEPLNIYSLVIAMPSERKSAVLNMMLKPVNAYEKQYNQENAARVEGNKMHRRILEKRQRAIEDQVAKGKADVSEMEKIAQEIADFEELRPLQMYVDDITTEKLVSVISNNHGRASLVSSEGGIFDTLAGIYTKNVNIDVMLKSYSGDPIRVDRIGRESESINNPALTILLMAQPNVVSAVLGNKTFRGRGLTARFLYCMPVSKVGNRNFNSESVTEELYRGYERKFFNMLEDEYPPEPEIITLSDDARNLLSAFADEIEPKLKKEYADMSDWGGKLIGNTLRMAGLLCRAGKMRGHEFLEEEEQLVVDEGTMTNAIRLGRYYLNHAQSAYDVLPEDGMYKQAIRILEVLKEKEVEEFDRRMAMRLCRSFKTVAEIQPVIDFLDDFGYIVQKPGKQAGITGRPQLPKYLVNPAVKNWICPL